MSCMTEPRQLSGDIQRFRPGFKQVQQQTHQLPTPLILQVLPLQHTSTSPSKTKETTPMPVLQTLGFLTDLVGPHHMNRGHCPSPHSSKASSVRAKSHTGSHAPRPRVPRPAPRAADRTAACMKFTTAEPKAEATKILSPWAAVGRPIQEEQR